MVKIDARWLEICRAYADCDMNTLKTSRELGIPRGTLQYWFKQIADETGLNPLVFYDLNELLWMGTED